MQTVELTPYHSAIPSWSGFQYQGKVAINVVLDYILNDCTGDYSDHFLELEWYEDFSIVKGEQEYLSIHQVKSYKNKNLSEYKDAIWNLLGKSLFNSCNQCYLHSSTELETEDEIKEHLKRLNPPNEPTISETANGPKVRGYTPWHYYNMVMSAEAYETSFQKFSRYQYAESRNYCTLNNLEVEIKERIIEYLLKHQGEVPTETQVDTTYHYLLGEIDKNVTKRHAREQQDDKTNIDPPERIKFTKFIAVLQTNWEAPTKEYVIHKLRNVFHSNCENLFIELHSDILESGETERLSNIEKIENYARSFGSFSNDEFYTFCQMVTPHIEVLKADEDAYRYLLPPDGIDVLFTALYEIKHILIDQKYKYIFQNTSYLPSTIRLIPLAIRNQARELSKIAIGILSNTTIREELFEIETIITENVITDSLESAANKFTDIDDSEVDENDNIIKIKKIRLIDITKAMEELK